MCLRAPWVRVKEMCAENVFKIENVHPFTRTPRTLGCRPDTSGRSLLHDHFVNKKLSEKEERQERGRTLVAFDVVRAVALGPDDHRQRALVVHRHAAERAVP